MAAVNPGFELGTALAVAKCACDVVIKPIASVPKRLSPSFGAFQADHHSSLACSFRDCCPLHCLLAACAIHRNHLRPPQLPDASFYDGHYIRVAADLLPLADLR